MPKCKWRACDTLVAEGQELCPRHQFMAKLNQDKAEARHRKAVLERKITTPMPKTRRELIQYGYQFCDSDTCRGCGQHIEFWRTPNGNRAPYDPTGDVDSPVVSHFATCPDAARFRRSA